MSVPWDFKTHSMDNDTKEPLIVNAKDALKIVIETYGGIGLIIASGKMIYDDNDLSFKKWHDELKGEKSKYVKKIEGRKANPRRRKISFDLKKIYFIKYDNNSLQNAGSFQKGFINSNDVPRKEKATLRLSNLNSNDILKELYF
jgi:hypothetical protein